MLQEVTCCNIGNSLFPKLCIAIFLPEHSHISTMSTCYKYNIRLDNIIIVFCLYFYTTVAMILVDVGQRGIHKLWFLWSTICLQDLSSSRISSIKCWIKTSTYQHKLLKVDSIISNEKMVVSTHDFFFFF